MSESLFSDITRISKLKKEIEELKKEIEELKKENMKIKEKNACLEQKEIDRTKFNIDAECLCLYTHQTGSYIYGNIKQLEKIHENCSDLQHETSNNHAKWGAGHRFLSIADARTCLLRNGYKLLYVSNTHWCPTIQKLEIENWVKGI